MTGGIVAKEVDDGKDQSKSEGRYEKGPAATTTSNAQEAE